VNYLVTAVSDGLGSGVVSVDLYGFPWGLSKHCTVAPCQLQWQLPANQNNNTILFTGEATDAYGNKGADAFGIMLSCTTTNNVETCSATRIDAALQPPK
jgi:hypothetical protein